ncbi:14699_t:CDS:2 [Ambispora leptoticha]|uniref:14699_t:CDS:1 n=1 Tax=Ambispora leptoticha TaxID=144679 RepID=A0A9N9EXC8_9GLOM|nr:14699_t:CDS:2 [Ambispora leptoticha]
MYQPEKTLLYEYKYYLCTGSSIVPTLQKGIDTTRVELFSNNPCTVYVYDRACYHQISKYNTKLEAAQAFECSVNELESFIDKYILFKNKYFLTSKSLSPDYQKKTQDDSDADDASSGSDDSSKSDDESDDEPPFRETDFQEPDGFRNCRDFPALVERSKRYKKGKPCKIIGLDALGQEYASKTVTYYRLKKYGEDCYSKKTCGEEMKTLVEEDNSGPLDLPPLELLEAINKFAADHFKKNDLKDMFGKMNGTALVAIGIIIQEYVRNIMLKPPE